MSTNVLFVLISLFANSNLSFIAYIKYAMNPATTPRSITPASTRQTILVAFLDILCSSFLYFTSMDNCRVEISSSGIASPDAGIFSFL